MSDLSDVEFNERMLKGIALSVLTGTLGAWSFTIAMTSAASAAQKTAGDTWSTIVVTALIGGLLSFACVPCAGAFFVRGGSFALAVPSILLPTLAACIAAGLWVRFQPSCTAVVFGPLGCMMVFAIAASLFRRARKGPPHICEFCGYDKTGLVATRCPECGRSPFEARQ